MEKYGSDRATAILNFWFGDPEDPEYGQQRKAWFQKDPGFDAEIRQQFLSDYERAAAGEYDVWQSQPRSCVALILLLDQFPRNLFRNSSQAFATDAKALSVAQYAVAQGFDRQLIPAERMFVYLPFEHCEELAQQDRCVQLFEQLMVDAPEFESTLDYALRHREVIDRFGRFPHRNEVLERDTTPAEAEFLQQPGSRF
ncbi:DUF924 domain-containing protein [filamentous cyanobacterium CCP5]|nr:DUF924 domain-containing protein [filamentous cyanobacterium CCP5]